VCKHSSFGEIHAGRRTDNIDVPINQISTHLFEITCSRFGTPNKNVYDRSDIRVLRERFSRDIGVDAVVYRERICACGSSADERQDEAKKGRENIGFSSNSGNKANFQSPSYVLMFFTFKYEFMRIMRWRMTGPFSISSINVPVSDFDDFLKNNTMKSNRSRSETRVSNEWSDQIGVTCMFSGTRKHFTGKSIGMNNIFSRITRVSFFAS
jgi:hypothetical protein